MAFLLLANYSMAQSSADKILGTWLTEEGKSNVVIFKKEGKFYGKIIKLKEPMENDKEKIDKNNPEGHLQKRTIVGIQVLKGFAYEDGEYEDGTIYDPENGKTYSCVIKFTDSNTLDVRGYIGFSWIGRTTVWTRIK